MFGIGLDDSFVIFQEYIRTGTEKDIVERIEDVFEEVALSITLTTVTTAVSFALAMFSNFPMLVWCAAYAFPTVLIDFFYQITFFVALIVLDERRIMARREKEAAALSEMPTAEPKEELSLQQSNPSIQEQERQFEDIAQAIEPQGQTQALSENEQESQPKPETRLVHIHQHRHQPNPKPASMVDEFMQWYGKKLLHPVTKACVLFGFAALGSGLIYSSSLFRQSFDVVQLLPSGSYLKDFLQALDYYGEGKGWLLPTAYFRDVDQSDPDVQRQMDAYINDLVDMDSISSQPPFFWLRHFQEFLTYDERLPDLNFTQQMDIFLSIDNFRLLYGDHIVRDPESGDVLASRCVLYMDNVDYSSVHEQIEIYKEQNEIAGLQPINMASQNDSGERRPFFLYDGAFYAWEFYAFFVNELISTVVGGVISVCFIAFLFMPHWSAVLFLFPLMSVQCIELIGEFSPSCWE